MSVIRSAATFSSYFRVDPATLARRGALDPTLAVDTPLFIDPLLLASSRHPEMKEAANRYHAHFRTIASLLEASTRVDDVPWRNARRALQFHEFRGTCLGYGAASIRGSGFGVKLTERVLATAKEIIALGVTHPDLFTALALFEDDIGADRISDMTTNVVLPALVSFTVRILQGFQIPTQAFVLKDATVELPANPFEPDTPIVLVPTEVLRDLPIARDWDDVARAARKTRELRERVNKHIAELWTVRSKRRRRELRREALASKAAFETLLDAVRTAPPKPYDIEADPEDAIRWSRVGRLYAADHPLALDAPAGVDLRAAVRIVDRIVARFRYLIEKKGMWKELWHEGRPRHEKAAQRLFFAIADSYCEANNLDLSPEADSGSGPVDFKFSKGYGTRVLVEVKLSTNTGLIPGYTKQLEAYRLAEQAPRATFLVVDVGRLGRKDSTLLKLRDNARAEGRFAAEVEFVDGSPQRSASKRR